MYNKPALAPLRRNRTGVRLFHSSDYRKNTNIYRNPSPNFCKQFIKDQKLPLAYPSLYPLSLALLRKAVARKKSDKIADKIPTIT